MKILIASRSSTLCGSYDANCPSSALFPPRQKIAFHEAVLDEILEERVESRRNRWNPRGIKRKMSNYPLRASKGAKHSKPIQDCIEIALSERYWSLGGSGVHTQSRTR